MKHIEATQTFVVAKPNVASALCLRSRIKADIFDIKVMKIREKK